jgi:hypothetical protein
LIYPNQLKVVEDSKLKVIVTQNYFKGSHYLIEATYDDGNLFFVSDEEIVIGSKIFIDI